MELEEWVRKRLEGGWSKEEVEKELLRSGYDPSVARRIVKETDEKSSIKPLWIRSPGKIFIGLLVIVLLATIVIIGPQALEREPSPASAESEDGASPIFNGSQEHYTDTVSPIISSSSHSPDNPSCADEVEISVEAYDNGVGLETIEINVDGGNTERTCSSSPCSYRTTYSAGSSHRYTTTVTDAAGNAVESRNERFVISNPDDLCDGVDGDCDGQVDEDASCGKGRTCSSSGKCKSLPRMCSQTEFSMGFVLLHKPGDSPSQEELNRILEVKDRFPEKFSDATLENGEMDTSHEVMTLEITDDMIGHNDMPNELKVMPEFYGKYPDKFDFVALYTTFDVPDSPLSLHSVVQNYVTGIGEPNVNYTASYGSGGRLIGILSMGQIVADSSSSGVTRTVDQHVYGLLHETGHQWCCGIGESFSGGRDASSLEITDGTSHYYIGLDHPYDQESTPLGSANWIPNDNGTYQLQLSGKDGVRYHPFTLYSMGLLPESLYDERYWIYDAGIKGTDSYHPMNATRYRQVSVDDIIESEGNRSCEIPDR